MLMFEQDGTLNGEKTYRLTVNGTVVSGGMTLDQVIRAINNRDEERLGEEHAPDIGEPRAERRRKAATGPGCRR